ncbi:hypothetical protein APHAL10511_006441 [Amanita phalloides]|nr:hypothetical protein APHAL10511_006441 [Amanita phalloides]
MDLEMTRAATQKKQSLLSRARLSYRQPNSHQERFQYVRGELIGKGSYGHVYLGLNASTGEVVAIKQVELLSSAVGRSISRKQRDIIESFKIENDMLKDLDHTHIVKYLGYEESNQHLSIFLEYVPGGTIKSCLNKYGRFRDDVTKSFTSQLLSGLKYLHFKGIIHRDLKADNILLEPSGVCKISDFGISKKVEDLHDIRAFTSMRGTVQWMAPEILDSKNTGYDAKVDIWSVGCIALEMWSGEKPWNDENLVSVLYKVSQYREAPPIPPGLQLSDMADHFRLQCFQANPQDRPTAEELHAHPYLRLPPDWSFPYVMHEDSIDRRPFSVSSLSRIDRGAQRVPTLRPVMESSPIARITQTLHSLNVVTVGHDHIIDDANTVQQSIPNNGPPIVVITPPSSPKDGSFAYDDFEMRTKLSDTSEGARSSRHHKRKLLVVANPDDDSDLDSSSRDPQRNQYVYMPPPLPETTSAGKPARPSLHRRYLSEDYSFNVSREPMNSSTIQSPSSSNISPPTSGNSSSTANSSLFSRPSRPRVNTIVDVSQVSHSDDSDTDDDLHLWNKPPVDLHKEYNDRRLTSISSPTLTQPYEDEPFSTSTPSNRISRGDERMKTPDSASRRSWLTRPDLEDVYEHLQRFFPHHDVGGQTSIPLRMSDTGAIFSDARSGDKSKRQQEKTRSGLGQFRRMTKFWGSLTDER